MLKTINISPEQNQLEGSGFKKNWRREFERTEGEWNKLVKPAVKVATPFIGIAVGDKTKNPKVVQATSKILKSLSGHKVLSLTDMHGKGHRWKVMWFHFN